MNIVAVHRVEWDEHRPYFTCEGDADSICRNYPSCDCDIWSEDHEHPYEPQTECLYLPWLEEDGIDSELVYFDDDGEPIQPPDGEIEVSWNGDSYSWVYTDPKNEMWVASMALGEGAA